MDFGAVIMFMKKHPFIKVYGKILNEGSPPYNKFRRNGWEDKNKYIFLTRGSNVPVDKWQGDLPPFNDGSSVRIRSHIDMIDGQGRLIVGWTPTMEDMLADDWENLIIEIGDINE